MVLVFALMMRADTSEEEDFDRRMYGFLLCVLALAIPVMIMGYCAKMLSKPPSLRSPSLQEIVLMAAGLDTVQVVTDAAVSTVGGGQ